MKKSILTLALLTGLTGAAQAQNISLGLKAGGTYSSFTGPEAGDPKGLFGFHAGGFVNVGITQLFAFQPELLYSQKGARYQAINGTTTTRLHYVDIPLAFHVNADGLFFEAGPQVGLLVGAQLKEANRSYDIKDTYNDFDFGYLFGLGYQRKTGPGIGLRYNGGFTSTKPSGSIGNVTIENRRRNSVFQLYLTYSFRGR